jgi:hypothetical protein
MLKNIYSLLLITLCAGILSIAVQPAQAEFREKGIAIIEQKGPNALMFDGHGFKHFKSRYMLVTKITRIYDENGLKISYANLKFPCQTQILYRNNTSTGLPEAISVHVEHYLRNREIGTGWNLPVIKPQPPQ